MTNICLNICITAPGQKEIRLDHGKEGASALPRIKSDMVTERKRQYIHSDLFSLGPSHLGQKKAKKQNTGIYVALWN